MAESRLRESAVPEAAWTGRRFRYSENLEDGMWASVVTEIERRDGDWIVTRLDRSRERVPSTGLEEVPA
jgi:hypothetical protein